MRLTTLNPATQQLEEVSAPASELFFKVGVHEPYGSALVNTSRFLLVSLDSLCELVAERIAVLEAADKPTKPKRKVAA
jgi:hypothetical protein